MKPISILFLTTGLFLACRSQTNRVALSEMAAAADKFLQTLSTDQKAKAQFQFSDEERYNWDFRPKSRKGIPLKELNKGQHEAAMNLLHTALSDTGFEKATSIFALEAVLKVVENLPANSDFRDSTKYYFSIFGNPATDSIWGWRLEGHHVAFNFSSENNRLISGTPGFLGANPAVVLSGPEKGKEILKDETELGFTLLHSLDTEQKKKAIINVNAPAEILTDVYRKAMISDPQGILYNELNNSQQKIFMQLLSIYIHRYTRLFAFDMMHEIEAAGLNNLRFAWAGAQQSGLGNPHYYRLQGPTIIIEYDNTQNNANHVHTVVRDLKNDFGGDELFQHYEMYKH
jgi:hypothetical protein